MRRALAITSTLLCLCATSPRSVKISRDSDALDFTYGWPSEAAAIPALSSKFREVMQKEYRKALSLGRADLKLYKEQGRPGKDFYSMVWKTAGSTPALLSLQNQFSTYTGGAHPNSSFGSLLWDKTLGREISINALFSSKSAFEAALRPAYCSALQVERRKRRGGEKLDGMFEECPKFSELAIAPVDENDDRRFDKIDFVASPYTAGPYAEGAYEISLPVTAHLLTALKPRYRRSFTPQRQ